MRVVEPSSYKVSQPKKKRSYRLHLAIFTFLIAVLFCVFFLIRGNDKAKPQDTQQVAEQQDSKPDQTSPDDPVDNVKDTLVVFSPNGFRTFYDNLRLPNLEIIENPPVISGNEIADARIRKIAEDRGYRLRNSPSSTLPSVDGYQLQEPMIESWKKLRSQASSAGLNMSIVSGYRSVSDQRALFLQRLSALGVTIDQVASGTADDKVNKLLITTSIPGYSKHHTGYTFDLFCAGFEFENFKNSTCNTWLSADNFKVAKENGFIPSYPPGADLQGPDPEAWEYVWVGTDLLYE